MKGHGSARPSRILLNLTIELITKFDLLISCAVKSFSIALYRKHVMKLQLKMRKKQSKERRRRKMNSVQLSGRLTRDLELRRLDNSNQTAVVNFILNKRAILQNASAVVFTHNHPSGDSQPSHEDILLTNRLEDCGKILGIRLLDHIIIGDVYKEDYYSFKEEGLL